MEYLDLHCDTPLSTNPVINQQNIKTLKATINFAFCFLHNQDKHEKMLYFEKFLQSQILKTENLRFFFSLEGLRTFNDIEEVVFFINKYPIKIVSVTWNEKNKWGCGCMEENCHLTDMGKDLLSFLNEQNIIIDISHASEKTAEDILKMAKHVVATHSNFFDICPHPRNLKKWAVDAMIERKGVVGLNFYMKFIGNDRKDFFKHIEYAIKNDFIDHLSIGSDFDGMHNGIINSPAEIPELYNEIATKFNANIATNIVSGKAFYKFYDFIFR